MKKRVFGIVLGIAATAVLVSSLGVGLQAQIVECPIKGCPDGGSVGECVSACEATRQEAFQKCLDKGGNANLCAANTNASARKCKAGCKAKRK